MMKLNVWPDSFAPRDSSNVLALGSLASNTLSVTPSASPTKARSRCPRTAAAFLAFCNYSAVNSTLTSADGMVISFSGVVRIDGSAE